MAAIADLTPGTVVLISGTVVSADPDARHFDNVIVKVTESMFDGEHRLLAVTADELAID